MPERRYYAWRTPPTIMDRAYAHPGTVSLSMAAIFTGLGLMLVISDNVEGYRALLVLPTWLKLWLGGLLMLGGIVSLFGLFKTWPALDRGWLMEKIGWTLQVASWGVLATLILVFVNSAMLTLPLLFSAAIASALRLRALSLVEKEARKITKKGGD